MPSRMRFNQQRVGITSQSKVDRENKIIRDVVAMQIGPGQDSRFLGVDLISLQETQDLGNAKPHGVIMRFGHPGASENAMGKQVAWGKNFRVVGDRLIHDAHLMLPASKSPAFDHDPLEYLMDMAEDEPFAIAESVVVNCYKAWVLDDGTEFDTDNPPDGIEFENGKPTRAIYDYPVLRITKLHQVDFVTEGNLTPDGLHKQFAQAMFDDSVHGDLFELFNMADETVQRYDIPIEVIPSKIVQLGNSYLSKIGSEERLIMDPLETNDVVQHDETADAPPASTPLAQADIDALRQQVDALQSAQAEAVPASTEAFDGLQDRVAQLEAQNAQLVAQNAQLFEIMKAMATGLQGVQANQDTLDSKLRVLNNEQVQTVPVSNHNPMVSNAFMNQAFGEVEDQNPMHFSQRKTEVANPNPQQQRISLPQMGGNLAAQSLAASMSRQIIDD